MQISEEDKNITGANPSNTGANQTGTAETGPASTSRPETSANNSTGTNNEPNPAGSTETGGPKTGGGTPTIPSITDNRPRVVRIDEMPEPPAPKKRGPKGPWKNKKVEEFNAEFVPDEMPEPASPSKFEKLNAKDLNLMICGTFDILAVALGKHWAITPDEGEKISKPAARILSRMAVAKVINKYSDYTVLFMALIGIVGPRLLFTLSLKTENKEVRNHVQRVNPGNEQQQPTDGEKSQTVSNPKQPLQQTAYTIPNGIHDILPAIMS